MLVYNACTSANCLDKFNIALIDNELMLEHPIHARVHWAGQDENYHSVVIIGHVGTDFYIHDPLALDSSPRTLRTGVEDEYIVDYLIPTHGNPPTNAVLLALHRLERISQCFTSINLASTAMFL